MKRINENQKVTLTFGQLKKLVKESQEWVGKWNAIDGHPDGGEMDAEFEGYCDCCGEYVDDPSRLNTLYGWFINDESCRTDNDEWNNRIDSIAAKMDDDMYEEFVSEFDCDCDDYCEYCAIDKLEELAKKYIK